MQPVLPIRIARTETLLRSLRGRDLSSSGKVSWTAVKPPTSAPFEISLIRQRIGDSAAKAAAIQYVYHGAPTEFWGFGTALYAEIRRLGFKVVDDRTYFLGHANLQFPFQLRRGAPNSPAVADAVHEENVARLVKLAGLLDVRADADGASAGWEGEGLRAISTASRGLRPSLVRASKALSSRIVRLRRRP
jgi:hypothetical protein